MDKYIFSGSISKKCINFFKNFKSFEPIDLLITQLSRSDIRQGIELVKEGTAKSLFIDSGAFSVHTGKCKGIDIEEYAQYLDSIDEYVYAMAQVDTIPGKFGQSKTSQDYIDSAEKSWENYLEMRKLVKSPHKIVAVYHQGEPVEYLKRMIDYRDTSVEEKEFECPFIGKVYNNRLNILGISPANDLGEPAKDKFIGTVMSIIENSSNPNIRVHLFGSTNMKILEKYPVFSADSAAHCFRSGYNKVFLCDYGVTNLSSRRKYKSRSNISVQEGYEQNQIDELNEYLKSNYDCDLDQLSESCELRRAVDMAEIQKALRTKYKYKDHIVKKTKSLI